MKTQILKSIFLCLLSSFFCPLNANAQIVYTDVNPDTTVGVGAFILNNDTLALDLNNDLVNDFHLITHDQHGGCGSNFHATVRAYANVSTDSSAFVATTGGLPSALNAGQLIDSNLVWTGTYNFWISLKTYIATGNPCAGNGTYYGNWSDSIADYFLPVKIIQSGNNYYGWLRLKIFQVTGAWDIHFSVILKDYAYNSIPDQFIFAGDTGTVSTGIIYSNIQANHLSVYPNPAINLVTLKFPPDGYRDDEAGNISIVNLFGQIVFSEKVNSEQKTIDISKFPEGMYVVRWNSGENFETKTFSIIK